MLYRAAVDFYDLQDYTETKTGKAYHKYSAGDPFPRHGVRVSEARFAELAGSGNRMGYPLIEECLPPEMPLEETEKEPEEVLAEEEKTAPEGESKATEGRRKKS